MSTSIQKWDCRFLRLAEEISTWSKDPSTKVGAIIVNDRRIISTGYNGFPRGIADDDRLTDRVMKYPRVVHAELNAIFNAARNGQPVDGADIYVHGLPVCHDCAKAVIQSGISRVVMLKSFAPSMNKWLTDWEISLDMFNESGVEVVIYDGGDPCQS